MKHVKTHGSDDGADGRRIRFSVRKNSIGIPGRVWEVDLMFKDGIGFDWAGNLVEIGIDVGLIQKAGPWLRLTDDDGDHPAEQQRAAIHDGGAGVGARGGEFHGAVACLCKRAGREAEVS